jgi:hypothetical protein
MEFINAALWPLLAVAALGGLVTIAAWLRTIHQQLRLIQLELRSFNAEGVEALLKIGHETHLSGEALDRISVTLSETLGPSENWYPSTRLAQIASIVLGRLKAEEEAKFNG